ncbi:MAG: site-specific DNA-methyltransferase [Actinomycetota bacterium]|nr:site-specific DNA-methyltransferase [Actinomycetota bacterium]
MKYPDDYINKIIQGDTKTVLKTIPDESVNCCVTSPPYWSLRDYGVEPVIWDGDKNCEHEWGNKRKIPKTTQWNTGGVFDPNNRKTVQEESYIGQFCLKCNAWRGSLGLEPTFELYIKHLCDIFDEVKRVLREDGTCWVNLGDSYSGGGRGWQGKNDYKKLNEKGVKSIKTNIPDKSLMLIPQRFAIEMVNRGWILRNTIIWHKPNCMPSSAKDRFTVDFEYVYFFVKSKKYWFEQQFEKHLTIKEFQKRDMLKRKLNDSNKQYSKHSHGPNDYNPNGRNKRTVWTIPTQPFPEAHFAVYPEGLIEIPIKAGCPEFVCKKCGKARVKIYKGKSDNAFNIGARDTKSGRFKEKWGSTQRTRPHYEKYKGDKEFAGEGKKFIGYTDCGCNAGFEGGIVLDPFMGAGTTALVALKQRKRFIGIEIKQEYIDMAYKRIVKVQQKIF